MKISNGSICGDCKYFEHECYEEYCGEYCNCSSEEIKEIFYDSDEVKECIRFEE